MREVDYPVVTLDYIIIALNFEINFKVSRVTSKATLASSEIVVYTHEKIQISTLLCSNPTRLKKYKAFVTKRRIKKNKKK